MKERHESPPLPLLKMPARKHTRNPHQDIGSTFHLSSLFFQRFQGQQSRCGGGRGRSPWDLDVCDLQQLYILGVQCAGPRAGDQSLVPRTEGDLGLWREGAIRPVELRDGDAANFTLRCGLDLPILAPLQKGWVSPEVKPASCLWLSLAGVPWPCQPPALPQHPPRAHHPCSTSSPSIWFGGWGEKARGENPLSNFLIPGEREKKAI